MTFCEHSGLRYFQFDLFPSDEIVHGIFTRHGGVSSQPWQTLNLGGTVGDSRDNVIENRRRIFEAVERPVESIFDVWQVHSSDVVVTERPRPLDEPHTKADAIITNRTDITLFMRFADCVPILLYDPRQRAVGIVHAGWQGTIKKIAAKTVAAMQKAFGSRPEDILAGIGPSIGPDHYEVQDDVVQPALAAFNGLAAEVLVNRRKRTFLDLWTANRLTLEACGVKSIQVAEICTACNTHDWYSHRGEAGKTGRFGTLIGLRDGGLHDDR